MAAFTAYLRLSRMSNKKVFKTLTSQRFPKLLSPAFFSSLCKNKHFYFQRPLHLPPEAKKLPLETSAHGVTWKDPFHWMSNANDPDFISYLHRENSYADEFMRDTEELQRTLYSEMFSRMPSKIFTPTERWGPWKGDMQMFSSSKFMEGFEVIHSRRIGQEPEAGGMKKNSSFHCLLQ